MRVKALKELLKDIPNEAEVVLSRDSEGNGFSPAYDYTYPAHYCAETTWSGEVYGEDDNPQDDTVICVVLWPAN